MADQAVALPPPITPPPITEPDVIAAVVELLEAPTLEEAG